MNMKLYLDNMYTTPAKESGKYISVISCGTYENVSQFQTARPDGRIDYQLIYIKDGTMVVTTKKGKSILGAGDIILFRPHEMQDYRSDGDNYASYCYIHFSGTGTEGKWLADFTQIEPEKGKEISRLLRSELTFSDNVAQKNNGNYIKYGVPVAGGIATNAIAKSLGAGGALSGAAGAVAVAAVYPIAKSYSEDVAKKQKSTMLDAYIAQLQLCKKKIEVIIQE